MAPRSVSLLGDDPGNCGPNPPMYAARYQNKQAGKAAKSLKILVLGGTYFFGTPLVQYAMERGHDVTLLNRGLTNSHSFPGARKIKSDRLSDNCYKEVVNTDWDVVIDTWQGNPLVVKESSQLLRERAKHYIYISSIAVYGRTNYAKPEIFETDTFTPAQPLPLSKMDTVADYRLRKQWGELVLQENFKDDHTIIRCHGIHGYYLEYPSPGQIYWPVRLQRGGDILCPGDGLDQITAIHVQDAAMFAMHCAENKSMGIYNVGQRYQWKDYIGTCASITSTKHTLHWTPLEQLQEQKNTTLQ